MLGSNSSIRTTFKTACERAGLQDVTPHTLRHTFACLLLHNGASLFDVAEMLGDDYKTVHQHYAHHCKERLQSTVDLLEI